MYLNNIFSDPVRLERLSDISQSAWLPLLEGLVQYTIPLTLIAFVLGLILAVLTALARISTVKILQWIARVYVSIIRGTPLLVQLFILFYGLPTIGVVIDPFPAAILGFSLNVGAYASEVIRASILSIPKGQWEAADTIGMTYVQSLRRVILPQAARVSIPPLSNTFISLVKDTSLASLILVTEMFRIAQQIAATNYEFLLLYGQAALIYWVVCFLLSIGQGRLEHRFDRYVSR
ncbi:cysteine ABC transporter permease [Planococcus glaciei]|uniref:Amino acid ABC transporter permease n=1 Tax=Planococcus glaciei TaxID=459472 RepID=A0A1G8LXI9_9BACL|nr:amino acid ABC transporter permease [Planococcus glaciei]ETP70116.1 cysteine ABC transporter permease [Planococcus glaciei CHR43]KOF12285.1 cysteine ABC transporter permease [Planococcus glaciei]MBX0314261.1 amino acid ABC transporter permease [Planococcus glaciei]QDY44923.1 amino acid ABC transporter permease [Planococcus glaciei]QKX49680.1 amino acid ABC transporter permease [Planococcus glaciei]